MKCPKCKLTYSVVPILYGFIIPDNENDKMEYVLGGCVIDNEQAEFYCKSCKTYFDSRSKIYKANNEDPNIYGGQMNPI